MIATATPVKGTSNIGGVYLLTDTAGEPQGVLDAGLAAAQLARLLAPARLVGMTPDEAASAMVDALLTVPDGAEADVFGRALIMAAEGIAGMNQEAARRRAAREAGRRG